MEALDAALFASNVGPAVGRHTGGIEGTGLGEEEGMIVVFCRTAGTGAGAECTGWSGPAGEKNSEERPIQTAGAWTLNGPHSPRSECPLASAVTVPKCV